MGVTALAAGWESEGEKEKKAAAFSLRDIK